MSDPILIMLCGPSCSGKSTLARKLMRAYDFNYLSTDELIQAEARRRGVRYEDIFKDYFPTANDQYQSKLREAINHRGDILIDRTHTTVYSRRKVLDLVRRPYVRTAICVGRCLCLAELQRRRARKASTDFAVPESVVERMWRDFHTEPPTEEEGFDLVLDHSGY